MFKINDYVVYKRNVCKIVDISKKVYNNQDYFVLKPIDDDSLKIEIPITNSNIRGIISKQELEQIIKDIPNVKTIDVDDKMLEGEYKKLMSSDSIMDLIKIIKTTFEKNQTRINNNRKVRDKDVLYFEKAEKCFYNELSLVLNKSFKETKNYIIELLQNGS